MLEPSREPKPNPNVQSSLNASFKQAENHTRNILSWANICAKTTLLAWVILVAIIFFLAGTTMVDTNPSYERLRPTASAAANIAACFQLSGILLRIVHQCFLDRSRWITRFGNGGFNTAIVVMSISAATNLLLANFPTPVFHDDVSGKATYPLRWAEWIIIGGTFTFMIESLDAQHWKRPAFLALRQSIIPLCGLICHFLPQFTGKILIRRVLMLFCIINTCSIFSRYYYSQKRVEENIVSEAEKKSFMGRLIITSNKLRLVFAVTAALLLLMFLGLFTLIFFGRKPPHVLNLAEPQLHIDVRFVVVCVIDCLSQLLLTAIVLEQYEMCLNHSKLIEEHFVRIGMELDVIWNHCSDVLIAIVEKERVSLHVSKDKRIVEISVRTSPSLLGLTGQTQLDDLRLGDEDTTGGAEALSLETVLRKAWAAQRNHQDDGKLPGSFDFTSEFKLVVNGTSKDCELVVNKVVRTAMTTTMVAVARDVSNRSKAFMLDFEREKNSIARETAHTVKNLNTMAHHKLLELLDELKNVPIALEQVRRDNQIKRHPKLVEFRAKQSEAFGVGIRQALAIMITAAQQTYQLSRVADIVRGEAAHLLTRVSDCTSTWEKICTSNFHADSGALALLVDEFRIVAILSNAWSNALAHGDCTRMDETEIILLANHADKTLEIKVVNASLHDERPFESVDETTVDDIVESRHKMDGFGASPAAKLTTQMGLKWMRKLCEERLSLKSEGNGGKTTLTCVLDADFSELEKSAIAAFVQSRKVKKRERAINATKSAATIPADVGDTAMERPIYSTADRPTSELSLSRTSSGMSPNSSDEPRLSMVCPLPPTSAIIPVFTSSPNKSASPLTPYASAHFELSERVDIRVWDTALSSALLRKFGVTIVDDSRAFAIQMQSGLAKAFNVKNCRTLCGSKTTRYAEICSLLHGATDAEPALILLDRNLGHGISNTDGKRLAMPTGDVVASCLRQNGFDCCLGLLTGDSSEQLKQYKRLYQGYLIDFVLDKHHLPSYVYIFEQYTQWIARKFPFGELLLGSMEVEEKTDENRTMHRTNSEEQMRLEALQTRCINKVRGLRKSLESARTELNVLQNKVKIYRGVRIGESKEGNSLESLVKSLGETLPLLKACKAHCLCALMEDVLLHPEAALAEALGAEDEREQENGNTEFSGETTIRKKPALLNKLAREVTLMQSIIVMSIGVLDECLNVQKKARGQKNWKIAQSKVANRGSDTATSQAG